MVDLVPSEDCHLNLLPENVVRSKNGLPYPKLNVFIQSLIDTLDRVALNDAIDGSNVDLKWGKENLDLDGTNDIAWAGRKNSKIKDIYGTAGQGILVETESYLRINIWENAVITKTDRLGFKYPPDLFITRFRLHGSPNPWEIYRSEA
ncbi:MAG: hypothetical protein M1814_002182 [Vezdaea aestivalis]|nr:MAG: hypothetical protein M1814_002182 [Vezdaea aestivalis]